MTRATLDFDGAHLWLECGPLDVDLARSIPGFGYDTATRRWKSAAAWGPALAARGVFGDALALTPQASAWGAEQVAAEQEVAAVKDGSAPAPPSEGLYPLQNVGVKLLTSRPAFALWDDPGAGKGVQLAAAAEMLPDSGFPMLVVTTKTMKPKHAVEFAKWAPSTEPTVIGGTAPQRSKQIAAALAERRSVLIISWDLLASHSALAPFGSATRSDTEKQPKDLNGGVIRTVALDEMHRLGDPKSKWTRAAKFLGGEATRRWGFTATPVPSPIGYWSELNFLSPQDFPSKSRFQDRYCLGESMYVKGREITKITAFNPRTEPELSRIADRLYVRRTLDEVRPGLPPLVYDTWWVDMEAKQRKAYDTMRKHMITVLDSGILMASDPMVASGRLLQIASAMPVLGPADDETGVASVIGLEAPSCKIDGLVDLIESRPTEQIVVFAQHRTLIELAETELRRRIKGLSVSTITGPVPEQERFDREASFQAGNIQVLMCTYGAGAEGITLTSAYTQAMLQRSFSVVKNTQADGRCRRADDLTASHSHVQIIDFIARNSYDQVVFESACYKDENAQRVLKDEGWVRRALSH